MHHYKLSTLIFLGLITQVFFTACNHYYKATQLPGLDHDQKAVIIDSLKGQRKYFILRNGERAHFMKNASVSKDTKSLTCILQKPGFDHRLHLKNGDDGKFKYNNRLPSERLVIIEVHFYITPDTATAMGSYSIALENIQKIEVIEKDSKRTTGSFVVGTLGVLTILTLAIWSSIY